MNMHYLLLKNNDVTFQVILEKENFNYDKAMPLSLLVSYIQTYLS